MMICGNRLCNGSYIIQMISLLHEGSLWVWPDFTTTSADDIVATTASRYTLSIQSLYGRDISEFSPYDEKEVLFVPGTCVRVLKMDADGCVLQEGKNILYSILFYKHDEILLFVAMITSLLVLFVDITVYISVFCLCDNMIRSVMSCSVIRLLCCDRVRCIYQR